MQITFSESFIATIATKLDDAECLCAQDVSNALAGLRVLAVVYRAARELFPLSADHVGCVTVYIDQLKAEADIESLCATAGIGNLWMLVREGEREAVAKKYVLLHNISLTAP